MPVSASFDLQMQFSGSAGVWTSVGADVIFSTPVTCSYGIRGTGPMDRVAQTGTLAFSLDNSNQNSGAAVGYYSPGNANARAGFEVGIGVRAALTYSGSTFYKFVGTLEDISPDPNIYGTRQTHCTAVDWMDEAARQKISLIATQVNQRGDQVITTVINAMTRKPAASAFNAGDDVFPYAIDVNRDLVDSPMTVFQNVCNSELGFLYIKGDTVTGGVLTFLDRHGRPSSGSALASLNGSMAAMNTKRSRAVIYNDVKTVVHPRAVDLSAVSLYKLNQAQSVNAFSTLTLQGQYTDPSTNNAVQVGALATCTLTINTDYLVNSASDGSGFDLSANVTVAASYGANSFQATVTNNTVVNGWLTKFIQRGRGLYDYLPIIHESIDTNSSGCFGNNVLTVDMPYQTDAAGTGKSAADYLLQVWSQPLTRIETVFFIGNVSDALMKAGLQREPSDRVTLSETVTGISGDFYIQGVDWSFGDKNTFSFAWLVVPTDPYAYWLIGVAGSSEIGQTTRVGY